MPATAAPPLVHYPAVVLPDCSRVGIRPVQPEDRPAFAAGFARLSDESRYRRFLSPKPKLSGTELRYLTEVDHVAHEALVAYDPADGRLLGVARYATGSEGSAADMAVTVADECQSMGLGFALAQRIVQRARANGISRLHATALRSNGASRALMRRLGFRVLAHSGPTVDLELPLV